MLTSRYPLGARSNVAVVNRRHLAPDRARRIWAIVECISQEPGLGRVELAQRFALSERQLQSDLVVIRDEIGLPLTRSRGYRFAPTDTSRSPLGLQDLVTLANLTRAAREEAGVGDAVLATCATNLAGAFPPQLRQLAHRLLVPEASDGVPPGAECFTLLAEALLRGQRVQLRYHSSRPSRSTVDWTVDPELLLPQGDSWFLVGYCKERRQAVTFRLDACESVAFV